MTTEVGPRRTIVALDVDSGHEAMTLVDQLQGIPGMFKVGLELFISEGPGVVRAIVDRGEKVFLDLKLHDIPNTVSRAALQAAELGVSMLTLHSSGGSEMIQETRRLLEEQFGQGRPRIVAVSVLTSLDDRALSETGVGGSVEGQVLRLAEMAKNAGADGMVCAPQEIRALRETFAGNLQIVTPGVRMPGQSSDDQARVATPQQALADGADWIVIGRYVNRAGDPRQAMLEVVGSL